MSSKMLTGNSKELKRTPAPTGAAARRQRTRRAQRGAALIIALAVVLALTILVVATQFQVVTQLGTSRDERDYERALEMAEAGANAYMNMLANGTPANGVANAGLIPPQLTYATVLTPSQFKTEAKNASSTIIPRSSLIKYPTGQTKQGYCAYQTATAGTTVTVIAYGWSNGVVRRVRMDALSFSIFDWAAIYGLNPSTSGYAWKFSGGANVVGASGGEGNLVNNNNATYYDGPVIWANGSYAAPYNNPDPTVLVSSPNVPTGHSGTGGLASPLYRHYARKLNVETADSAANSYSGATTGVEYYRNNNNNATGLRLLVKNSSTSVIRELPTPYTIPTTGNKAYQLNMPQNSDYTSGGMTGSERAFGLRIYPGNYFFEAVNMTTTDAVYLRTYTDAERSTIPSGSRQIMVSGDPANPNSGQAANQNVRFWIGHSSKGNDISSTFSCGNTGGTFMEYPQYASRFRVYIASSGGVVVKGTNGNPPPPFRVNLLSYNTDASGNGYGNVQFQSSVYLYGSLIGWQIDVAGGCTVQKEATEIGPGDRLTYVITGWTELQ
jgi:Tfp pilus assembly protein PilX